jgi:hypothetical protein
MARTYVDEGAEMWRVVVCFKKDLGPNPNYDWRDRDENGNNPNMPRIYSDTESVLNYYGPYKTEGTAKAQLKMRMQDSNGELWPAVLGGEYQKAHVVWEKVGGLQ